jgi:hypothetical protein
MSTRPVHFQIGAFGLLAVLLALGGCSSSGSKPGNTGGTGTAGTGFGGSSTGKGGTSAAGGTAGGGGDTGGAAAGGATVGPGGASGLGGAAGSSSAGGASGHPAECSGAPDPCFAGTNLVGTWHCPGNSGVTLVIGSNGSLDIKNATGQHGQGCISCTGSFEDVSAADSGGSPSTFVDVNGQLTPSTTMAGSATIKWQYCSNTTDLAACMTAPMASAANDTCSKTGP